MEAALLAGANASLDVTIGGGAGAGGGSGGGGGGGPSTLKASTDLGRQANNESK